MLEDPALMTKIGSRMASTTDLIDSCRSHSVGVGVEGRNDMIRYADTFGPVGQDDGHARTK